MESEEVHDEPLPKKLANALFWGIISMFVLFVLTANIAFVCIAIRCVRWAVE